MTFRLVTAIIFLFCGTMTLLLVRSVLYPEDSGLAAVTPAVPFNYFAARTEGSSLDIWDANRIIGSCEITPHNGGTGGAVQRDKVVVRIEIRIALPQELMGSGRLDVSGEVLLHSNGIVDNLKLEFVLSGSLPQVRLLVDQSGDRKWPMLKLTRGKDTLFEFAPGQPSDMASNLIVSAMLRNIGISEEAFSAKTSKDAGPGAVRAGYIEAGGETFDGYLFTSGSDRETQFRLYMSNTGQILRISTPLTGDNGLGLRLLAQSLAPKGAARPSILEGYAPTPPKP